LGVPSTPAFRRLVSIILRKRFNIFLISEQVMTIVIEAGKFGILG
jgi:hypothetical protein